MSAEWTFRFGVEPFSDALGVEVMLYVAGQRGYLGFWVELDSTDDALVICLELLRVIDVLCEAAQDIFLLRLFLLMVLSASPYLFEDAWETANHRKKHKSCN